MTQEEKKTLDGKIVATLKTCYDPEIPVDIYQLGLIYGIEISDEGEVGISMTLTAPNCPAAQSLPNEVKRKVSEMEEVESCEVAITFDPPWTPDRMDDSAKLALNML